MRTYILILLVLLSATHVYAGKKVRVLFLGNSYTYVNNMPQIAASLAAAGGDTLEWEMEAPGGYLLSGHYTSMASKAKIQKGNWDYVVLQEQSQHPALPYQQVFNTTFIYAHVLDTMINYYNPCGETVLYMTWGRKNGDAGMCATYSPQGWPHFCTYLGMDSVIRARYETIANDNQGVVSPAGAVWRVTRVKHPNIELYDADESHPSQAGSYAAACAFYTTIFRKDPTKLNYNYSLNATDAGNIRAAAKTVVFDSMAYWHIGQYRTEADFTHATGAGNAVNFSNASVNATSYTWHFGDGQTSGDANPSHSYNDTGKYTVMLIATKGGCNDTVYSEVHVGSVGIGNTVTAEQFMIAPNPVQDVLLIRSTWFSSTQCDVTVVNTYGRVIQKFTAASDEEQQLDVSAHAPGMYFVVVESGANVVYRGKFIKL